MARVNKGMMLLFFVVTIFALFVQGEFYKADVFPVAIDDTSMTVLVQFGCENTCIDGDSIVIDYFNKDNQQQDDFTFLKTNVTIFNSDTNVIIGKPIVTNHQLNKEGIGPTTLTTPIAGLDKTGTIQFLYIIDFVTNKKQATKGKFKFDDVFNLKFTYLSKQEGSQPSTGQYSFKVGSSLATDVVPLVSIFDGQITHSPRSFSIVVEDLKSDADVIFITFYGPVQIAAEKYTGTLEVNGIQISNIELLIDSEYSPFGKNSKTIKIPYKETTGRPLLNGNNLHISGEPGLNFFASLDPALKFSSYVSMIFEKIETDKPQLKYTSISTPIPIVLSNNIPTIVSTSKSDGNYIYQTVDITYSNPTSIKDVEYAVTFRNVKPQFSFIYVSNSTFIDTFAPDDPYTLISRERLSSTLQVDRVWYNQHTLRTSFHEINPMYDSNEFVASTYSIFIVTPVAGKSNSVTAQFTLRHAIKLANPAELSASTFWYDITTISIPSFYPAMVKYPQFDVVLHETKKDKVTINAESNNNNSEMVMLSVEEQEWYGTRNIETPLKFTLDFKKLLSEVHYLNLTFYTQQFIFVGDFSKGCYLDKKELPPATTIPLVDHPTQFTSINFTATVPKNEHFKISCDNGFIVHREVYQTDEILNAFYPLQIIGDLGLGNTINTTATTIMFHYPHHSIRNDYIFIMTCVILGIVIIPLSQLFLCWVHPTKDPRELEGDDNLINAGLLAATDDPSDEQGNDRFSRPMHSVHRRLNLVTQSEDPHH